MPCLRAERRSERPLAWRLAIPVLAVAAGLAAGALVMVLGGHDVSEAYTAMWDASLGTPRGLEDTIVKATPLVLTALAVVVALRMGLWNIGGEGQLVLGAIGSAGVGLLLEDAPLALRLVLMFAGGMAAGALWALIAAIPRAAIGLNEIITTLFLNYIALLFMAALITGPLADRTAIGFARSREVTGDADLPLIGSTRVNVGVFIALAAVLILWWLVERTRWGFGVRVAGGNTRAAQYLGLPVGRRIVTVLAISGALAGIAGVIQLTAATGGRLQDGLSGEYGYIGILAAFLARGRLLPVILVAFLFSALLTGGFALQATGVPSSIATVIQGLIIVFVLVGEWVGQHRVSLERRPATGEPPPAHPPATAEGVAR
jgi:ABC-type uncharacterized transport system permease subunit